MAQASDYPVTFPFGGTIYPYYYVPTPKTPKNPKWLANYHNGDDRRMPEGIAIVVNGTTIGYSGNTGASSAPHLHLGKMVNGVYVNPKGDGFSIAAPVTVTTVKYDSINGNWVRLTDANGTKWVYLHMREPSKLIAGQTLAGGTMDKTKLADSVSFLFLATAMGNKPGGYADEGQVNYWTDRIYKDPNTLNELAHALYSGKLNEEMRYKAFNEAGGYPFQVKEVDRLTKELESCGGSGEFVEATVYVKK